MFVWWVGAAGLLVLGLVLIRVFASGRHHARASTSEYSVESLARKASIDAVMRAQTVQLFGVRDVIRGYEPGNVAEFADDDEMPELVRPYIDAGWHSSSVVDKPTVTFLRDVAQTPNMWFDPIDSAQVDESRSSVWIDPSDLDRSHGLTQVDRKPRPTRPSEVPVGESDALASAA